MAVVGSAQVLIRPTFSGLQREIRKELEGIGEPAGRSAGSSLGDSLKKWGRRGAIVAGGAIAGGLAATLTSGFSRLTAIEDAEAMLRGLGHSVEEVEAIMQNAMDSTEGTAIRMDKMATTAAQMVAAGIEPGEELTRVLTLVGDAATIAGGDMDGMSDIFGKVAAANRLSMSEVNQMQERGIPILQMVADEMGVTQAAAREMVSAGEVDFALFESAMQENLGGAAQEAGGTMRGSFENLGAYVARVGASLLEGVFPSIKDGINSLSEWFQGLEPVAERIGEVVGEWLEGAAETVKGFIEEFREGEGVGGRVRDVFETVGDVLRTAFEFIRDTAVPALQSLWEWLKENEAWLVPIAVGIGAIVTAWKTYQIIMGIVRTVTLAFTAVQTALNAVLAMNPIGLVVLAIVGLIAALVTAYKRSETFRNVVDAVWTAIKDAIGAVWDWLQGVFESIGEWLDDVGAWFSGLGESIGEIWDGIKASISGAWDSITGVFDSIGEGLSQVGGWFSDRGQDIKDSWNNMKDGLSEGYNEVKDKVFDAFSNAWEGVSNFFTDDSTAIGKAFTSIRDDYFKPVWNWINDNIFQVFRDTWDLVKSVFTGDSEKIGSAFSDLRDTLRRVWNNIKSAVVDRFQNAWQNVKNFFSDRVDDMKSVWDSIKRPFQTVWEWIDDNVIQRFRRGVENIAGWIGDAVDGMDRAWRKVANKFRNPINWVIKTVWNDGIAGVFNNVASAIGISTRLPANAEIPKFAEGGRHSGGWAIVGEEGPELVNFSDPARIYTAAETAAALAEGRDLSAREGRAAAGRNPSEAVAPMGGNWLSRAWNAVTGWVRGGLAAAADLILSPLTDRIASTMGQWGSTGVLFGDAMTSAIDSLVTWIRGKDDEGPSLTSRGDWQRPSAGPITSRYGPRWGGFHAGIDIAGNNPVYAAAAGTVYRTGGGILGGRTGQGIGIDHGGGVFTYYGHNPYGGIRVRPGQAVTKGQRIGHQGATGNVTGIHTHFELHRGGWGRAINPETLGVFDQGGVLRAGHAALNMGRTPEAVLTNSQWRDISTLAARGQMDGMRITGTLDLGEGIEARIDGRLADLAAGSVRASTRRLG